MLTTDEMLAIRVQKGNVDSFEALVSRYQKPVFRVAYRMLGQKEDAEDAAQEVFLNVFQKIHQYDSTRKFSPWLYRIAVNTCISRLRGKKHMTISHFEESDMSSGSMSMETVPTPQMEIEQRELNEQIWKAAMELPDNYRSVLILRYQMDLSNQEIAEVLNLSKENVEVRLHRARKALRTRLLGSSNWS